jgi:hypothetical protein
VTDGDGFRLKDIDPGETLDLKSEDKPRAGGTGFPVGHALRLGPLGGGVDHLSGDGSGVALFVDCELRHLKNLNTCYL